MADLPIHPVNPPFPVVSGAAFGAACQPPRHGALPDFYVVDGPSNLLMLIPVDQLTGEVPEPPLPFAEPAQPHKERMILDAFGRLEGLVRAPIWSDGDQPVADLNRAFAEFGKQAGVRAGVTAVLAEDPHTLGSIDTFFNATLMAARADWRAMPEHIRGAAARGWYIGRWLPTTLMVDGPLTRLLTGHAFRTVEGDGVRYLRAARRFLQDPVVVRFRHALAHWSFEWSVHEDGSHIMCHGRDGVLDLHQLQADAIHIITFEITWALHHGCLRPRRDL